MTIIEEIAKYIETKVAEYSMPYIVFLNWVDDKKPCVGVVQNEAPVVSREYINGSRNCEARISVYVQDNHNKRNTTIANLEKLSNDFSQKNWKMSQTSDRCILSGEVTSPSLRNLNENGMSCFGTTITVLYKE